MRPDPLPDPLPEGEGIAAPHPQLGGFLMALRVRGETVEEITGAVTAMRAKMLPVAAPAGAIDVVGTGGDGSGSYNVSTLCGADRRRLRRAGRQARQSRRFVEVGHRRHARRARRQDRRRAGCGRALRSARPASASCSPRPITRRCGHVGPTRGELGTRTIFNLLGPLANPAGVQAAAHRRLLRRLAHSRWREVLRNLGSRAGVDHPRRRRARRNVDHRRDQDRRAQGRRDPRLRGRARRPRADARRSRLSSRAATPPHNAAALEGGAGRRAQSLTPKSPCSTPPARWWSPARPSELAEGVALAGDALASGPPPSGSSTGLLPSPMRDQVPVLLLNSTVLTSPEIQAAVFCFRKTSFSRAICRRKAFGGVNQRQMFF